MGQQKSMVADRKLAKVEFSPVCIPYAAAWLDVQSTETLVCLP